MLYTSLPVVMLGCLDQDVAPTKAVRFPGLYYPGMAKLWFSRKVFSNFAIHGLVTSLVLVGFLMGTSYEWPCICMLALLDFIVIVLVFSYSYYLLIEL